jgi:hypothetical protein
MSSLGGQISPPGSRHKSGGWRLLSSPEAASAAVKHPNGSEVWASLLDELAAELREVEGVAASGNVHQADISELDDIGVPWIPRLCGRGPLGAELEQVARSGRWDRSHYAGRSEARMAVLGRAAARGWRLDDVRTAITSGPWKGLAALYGRRSEPGRLERLLPYEWRKCVANISGEENVRQWHTSDLSTRPPTGRGTGKERATRGDVAAGFLAGFPAVCRLLPIASGRVVVIAAGGKPHGASAGAR